MRWRRRHKYEYGDYRVAEIFLLFPWTDFSGETRWLERTKIAQKCIGHFLGLFTEWSLPYRWADDLPVGDITFSQYDALG